MSLAVAGIGLLIGSPIAGALLGNSGWVALQAWGGSLILVSGILITRFLIDQIRIYSPRKLDLRGAHCQSVLLDRSGRSPVQRKETVAEVVVRNSLDSLTCLPFRYEKKHRWLRPSLYVNISSKRLFDPVFFKGLLREALKLLRLSNLVSLSSMKYHCDLP